MISSLENSIFAPERIRRLFFIFSIFYYCSLAVSLIYSNYTYWLAHGRPELIDFSWIWAVGQAVVSGNGGRVYDFSYFSTPQIAIFGHQGSAGGGFAYVYPPNFLFYLAPLGLLPYFPALLCWLVSTFLLSYTALRRITERPLATLLGAAPAGVAWNIKLGHTGFLAAGLIGLALALIEQAPFSGGLVLGLLTYKPQLGIVFPIVLIAAGQWRVLLGATTSTVLVAALTALFFGFGVWLDFFDFMTSRLATFRPDPLMTATTQTVYGFSIWLGYSVETARLIHFGVVVPVVMLVCMIWRRPVPYALKAASLALCALIATPYLLAYDLAVLAVPTGFLLKEIRHSGALPGERFALLAAWLLLFGIVIPVGGFVCAILLAVIVRRVFFIGEPRAVDAPATS
jgi:Glycosyltransferase family 87